MSSALARQAGSEVATTPRSGSPEDRVRKRYGRLAWAIATTDGLAILAAFLLAYVLRFSVRRTEFDFLAVMAVAPPVWIAIFAGFRLYSVHRFAPAEEFKRVIYAVTVGITGVVAVSYWTKAELSRIWVGLSWVLALVLVLGARRLWHHRIWTLRRRGELTFRTLIVGTNDEARHLASVMSSRRIGFEPIGYVSAGNGHTPGNDLPILGEVHSIRDVIRESGAECVFVASSALKTPDMRTVTKSARQEGVEVRMSANVPEMMSSRLAAQPIGGLMAFSIWPVRLSGSQAIAKRTFDLVASAVLLVVGSPLWLGAAISIKTTSHGPVFFRQTRVGRNGRLFTLLKFRTMVPNADAMLPGIRGESKTRAPLFKLRDDHRMTKVGKLLRRWSLDELPQLLNVIKGEMSLVGPRPSLPEEVETYEEWHRDRLEVPPGMTGLWQVSGRSQLTFDDYVRLDLFYIENWSLAYDLYLLAKTLPAVVSGKGAF